MIITTKSGRQQRGIGVTYSTSVTFDKAGYWPDFQYEYGAGDFRKTTINTGHTSDGLNPDEYSFYSVDADHSDTGVAVPTFHSRYQFGEKINGQMRYMYASYDPETDTYTRLPYEVCDWYKGLLPHGRHLHQQRGDRCQRRPRFAAPTLDQGYAQRLDRAQYGIQYAEHQLLGLQQSGTSGSRRRSR